MINSMNESNESLYSTKNKKKLISVETKEETLNKRKAKVKERQK